MPHICASSVLLTALNARSTITIVYLARPAGSYLLFRTVFNMLLGVLLKLEQSTQITVFLLMVFRITMLYYQGLPKLMLIGSMPYLYQIQRKLLSHTIAFKASLNSLATQVLIQMCCRTHQVSLLLKQQVTLLLLIASLLNAMLLATLVLVVLLMLLLGVLLVTLNVHLAVTDGT